MTKSKIVSGFFRNGMPHNRFGEGQRTIIIFQGLLFENKELTGLPGFFMTRIYKFLQDDYSVYIVNRRPGLPKKYSIEKMADDYAEMIREEFDGPVDVIGVSTGGSIAQHFAAKYPKLVRRLILHSSAYTLSDDAKHLQKQVGSLAQQLQWRKAYAAMLRFGFPKKGIKKYITKPVVWIGSFLAALLDAPDDPSDLAITIDAEDKHNFKNRLTEIKTPTLVLGGDKDPFYSEMLFRETAEKIPNAQLIVYKKMGHPASGKKFCQDVLSFLKEDNKTDA